MSKPTYCIVDGKVCKSFKDMFCCKECETYYYYVCSRNNITSAIEENCLPSSAEDAADDLEFEEECFEKRSSDEDLTNSNSDDDVYYHSSEDISELDEDSELSSEEEDDDEDGDFFNIYTAKKSNRDSIFSICKSSRKHNNSTASSFDNMSPLVQNHKDNNYKCIKFDSLFVPGGKQQLNCIETLVKNDHDINNYKKLTTIPQNSYQIWIKNQN